MSYAADPQDEVTKEQLQELADALVAAYDEDSLAHLSWFGLEEQRRNIVSKYEPFPRQVFALIDWCVRHSCIPELVTEAFNHNSGHPALARLVRRAEGWPPCKARGLTVYGGKAALFAQRAQEEAYLKAVRRRHAEAAACYVPLAAVRQERETPELRVWDSTALRTLAASGRGALVCGGAGAGKTALLQRLTGEYAAMAQEDAGAPLPLYVALDKWDGDDLLRCLQGSFGTGAGDDGVIDLGRHLPAYLNHGRVVLLLDEVGHPHHGSPAGAVQKLQALATRFPNVVIVAAARRAEAALLGDLDRWQLEPLNVAAQTVWARVYVGAGKSDRFLELLAGGADNLKRARQRGVQPHLLGLGSSPLVLKVLCDLYGDVEGRRRLSSNLGQLLYGDVIPALWAREAARMGSAAPAAADVLDALADLALAVKEQAPRPGRNRFLAAAAGTGLLAAAADEGGDAPAATFAHPLLEDCCAALALRRVLAAGGGLKGFWPNGWQAPSGWERPAVMLAGILPDMANLVQALIHANPITAARCLGESGGVLAEDDATGAVARSIKAAVRAALVEAAGGARVPYAVRCAAGDALNYVGDYRAGVNLLATGAPDIAWQLVGEGEAAFALARYPVTNVQFDAFYRSRGYETQSYWSAEGWEWRTQHRVEAPQPQGSGPDRANHPAAAVSWYEAQAFCGWLSELAGATVELPTGRQWEQGAGADDGRLYPHGDALTPEHANYRQAGLHRTSAVGMFPAGASPHGVLDLAGNVREWTLDGVGDGGQYAQRGGSFYEAAGGVACGHAIASAAGRRDERAGFRLATCDAALLGGLLGGIVMRPSA